jgi:hypothetical protein
MDQLQAYHYKMSTERLVDIIAGNDLPLPKCQELTVGRSPVVFGRLPEQFHSTKRHKRSSPNPFLAYIYPKNNMAVLEEHKIRLVELLKLILEELFSKIAIETGADYYAKILQGKVLFGLLLLSLLSEDCLGQRGITDLYASPHFRVLFNLESKRRKLSRNSLSERFAKVDTT